MANELNNDEVEQQRLERIAELEAEDGADWDDGFEPGTFGNHELLDRTYLVMNLLEQHVLDHPACLREPSWYALANRAFDALFELYQEVGAAQPEDAPADVVSQS
jgi:hypothetical protein